MRHALWLGLLVFSAGLAGGAVVLVATGLAHRWRVHRERRALARHHAHARRLLALWTLGSNGPQRAKPVAPALHAVRPDHPRLVRLQRHGDSRQGAEVKR